MITNELLIYYYLNFQIITGVFRKWGEIEKKTTKTMIEVALMWRVLTHCFVQLPSNISLCFLHLSWLSSFLSRQLHKSSFDAQHFSLSALLGAWDIVLKKAVHNIISCKMKWHHTIDLDVCVSEAGDSWLRHTNHAPMELLLPLHWGAKHCLYLHIQYKSCIYLNFLHEIFK